MQELLRYNVLVFLAFPALMCGVSAGAKSLGDVDVCGCACPDALLMLAAGESAFRRAVVSEACVNPAEVRASLQRR